MDIEQELNDLINKCREEGGFVWIVDKKQNNFAIRLTQEVKISIYEPKENSNED
jgi:hypothetical protein